MRNNYVREFSANDDVTHAVSCSVRGALGLTLRLSRLLGIAPVTFASEKDRGCVVRLTTEPNYYGYMLISLIHVCHLSGFIMDLTAADKHGGPLSTTFDSVKWVLTLSFLGFIATVGVLGARSRMETVITCLSTLGKIRRQETNVRGLNAEEMKRFVVFLIGVLSVVVEIPAHYLLSVDTGKRVSSLYYLTVLEVCMLIALEMQFLFIALSVNSALAALNDSVHTLLYIIDMQLSPSLPVLKTGIPDSKHIPVKRINAAVDNLKENIPIKDKVHTKSDVSRMVSRLILSYGDIGDVIGKLNAGYDVLLLGLLGYFLFSLVVTPHSLIICLYRGGSTTKIALTLITIGIHVLRLIMVAEPGSKIEVEMQRTKLLVCQLSSRGAQCERAVAFQLDLLYKQAQLIPASYTPMGVCVLNRPLVIEIFGAASTFLTIILQYRVLERNSQD